MTKIASFSLSTLTVLAVLAGAGYLRPQWAAGLGLDYWNFPELHGRFESEAQRSADLDRRLVIVLRRMASKDRVVAEVIAGRLGLREAAACFRELNETPADCANRYREFYPAGSAEEALCLQVLEWARNDLDTQPLRREAVVARLEAELREMRFRQDAGGLQ